MPIQTESSPQSEFFRAYGLTLESDFSFQELAAIAPMSADVRIKRVSMGVPQQGGQLASYFPIDAETIYVHQNEIATLKVCSGREIWVDPFPTAAPSVVRHFILHQGFSILLWQLGRVPLHSSAVVKDGHAYAFMGDSGAGKSTLCASLHLAGCTLGSDDIVSVECGKEGSGPLFQPSFPQLKLVQDSPVSIKADSHTQPLADNELEKQVWNADRDFSHESVPLKGIFSLRFGTELGIFRLPPKHCFGFLNQNTYGSSIMPAVGWQARHLKQCAEIIRTVPIYVLVRPKDFSVQPKVIELLLKQFKADLPPEITPA